MTFFTGEEWGKYKIIAPDRTSSKFRVIVETENGRDIAYADVDLTECRMWCIRQSLQEKPNAKKR